MKMFSFKFGHFIVFLFLGSSLLAAPNDASYTAKIKGTKNRSIKKKIEASTLTFKLKDRPPHTQRQLKQRVEKDLPRIESILESLGYFDGTVSMSITKPAPPYRVLFMLEPGNVYHWGTITLQMTNDSDPQLQAIKTELTSKDRAIASLIFQEQNRILKRIKESGYPLPQLEKRTITIDSEQHLVHVALVFNPGSLAHYGPLRVQGLKTLKPKYFQKKTPWKLGDQYDAKQVEDFETSLLETGLFSTARIEPLVTGNSSNTIPLQLTITERALRTIKLGVGYSDIGVTAKMAWEHRNVFGGGERLKTELAYSPIEARAFAQIERPGFLFNNQTLFFNIDASHATPDAYDSDAIRSGIGVKRQFNPFFTAGTGLRYKYSMVEQLSSSKHYSHLILPLFLTLDTRNDSLDPTRGGELFLTTQFFDDLNDQESFLKTELEGRLYQMLWPRPNLSAGIRLRLGSIHGTIVDNIPADERFYAGGGGSIRGYEYQSIGPQLNDTPVGGAQLLEFSTELRLKPGRKLGYVGFLDGGAIYNSLASESSRKIRYGAGIGLRWFTRIGPLRVDAAYPLNPTEAQSKRVQFYISLGQAF